MLKLKLIVQKIIKKLLMLNGKLFMKNSMHVLILELKLFCQNFQLEILQLNILLTEIFSVQEELVKLIWIDL